MTIKPYPFDGSTNLTYDEWYRRQLWPDGQGWKAEAKKVLNFCGKFFCCLFFPCCFFSSECGGRDDRSSSNRYSTLSHSYQYDPCAYNALKINLDGSRGGYGMWR